MHLGKSTLLSDVCMCALWMMRCNFTQLLTKIALSLLSRYHFYCRLERSEKKGQTNVMRELIEKITTSFPLFAYPGSALAVNRLFIVNECLSRYTLRHTSHSY